MVETNALITQSHTHAQIAVSFDERACKSNDPADFQNAKAEYINSVDCLYKAFKNTKDGPAKDRLRTQMQQYMDRAEVMKTWLERYNETQKQKQQQQQQPMQRENKRSVPTKKPPSGASSGDGGGGSGGASTASKRNNKQNNNNSEEEDDGDKTNDEDRKMQDQLGASILAEKPNVKWSDVAGLEGAKSALQEAVILPQRFPQIFVGKRKPWKGILLYGPPGTGKSYLAKAVATEADAQFFSVSSSDLVSKWQGESEKLVKQLFTMARKAKKAIIFIDEIDALVSSRSDNESESSRRIKTEFLVQMDGVGKSTDGVLFLGATNIPWGLDDALLRRMERRVYIPLPDHRARTRIFEMNLGETPHELTKQDFIALGELSEGYSGSDIAVVVRDAIMQPVRTVQNAKFFKKVMDNSSNGQMTEMWTPCSPGDNDAKQMTLEKIDSEKLLMPVIRRYDFEVALSKSKPSVGKDTIGRYDQFTKEKGQSGN